MENDEHLPSTSTGYCHMVDRKLYNHQHNKDEWYKGVVYCNVVILVSSFNQMGDLIVNKHLEFGAQIILEVNPHPKTNATLVDSDGFSPLYWTSKKWSSPRIINALFSKGCDPNERDMHGITALFAAVASNNKENVECLVKHPSININQVNQFGGSALHHTAFATDNVETTDVLVRHGANLFLLFDYEKQRPLHVAKRRNRKSLFKYFKDKMEEQEPTYICDVFMDKSETSDYEENDNDNKSLPRTQHCSMSNTIPIKPKPKPQRQISASPEPIINTVNTPWYSSEIPNIILADLMERDLSTLINNPLFLLNVLGLSLVV